jgi:hypothetical protein
MKSRLLAAVVVLVNLTVMACGGEDPPTKEPAAAATVATAKAALGKRTEVKDAHDRLAN